MVKALLLMNTVGKPDRTKLDELKKTFSRGSSSIGEILILEGSLFDISMVINAGDQRELKMFALQIREQDYIRSACSLQASYTL